MADIIITMREEGIDPVAFKIPSSVAAKMQAHIDALQGSAVLGLPALSGKAEWFARECYAKILKPILDANPEPPPDEALTKMAQVRQLTIEIASLIAAAAVQPIEIVPVPPDPE